MQARPVRTCIGCGAKAEQPSLVRLCVADGRVDLATRSRGGRGAWLHPGDACLERALKRKAFGRAFRSTDVRVEARELRELLTGSPRKD
jgi:predicted RNA-binding protein YlxR (DUF448 family)